MLKPEYFCDISPHVVTKMSGTVVAAVVVLGLATARGEWAKTDLVFCTLSQVPSSSYHHHHHIVTQLFRRST